MKHNIPSILSWLIMQLLVFQIKAGQYWFHIIQLLEEKCLQFNKRGWIISFFWGHGWEGAEWLHLGRCHSMVTGEGAEKKMKFRKFRSETPKLACFTLWLIPGLITSCSRQSTWKLLKRISLQEGTLAMWSVSWPSERKLSSLKPVV